MTGANLVIELGRRVEDEDNDNFSVDHKLQALNNGAKTITTLLHNYYLSTLKRVANDKTLAVSSSTGFATQDFSTLFGGISTFPVREGITRIYDNTNSRYAQLVPEQSFMPSKTYSYGTIACIEGNQLAIAPSTVTSIDVHYIAQPTAIANDSTVDEWYNGLENIILDLAESEIFYADNRPNRAGVAYQRAINMIQTLNDRAVGELVG